MADEDATRGEHVLDHAQAERKAEVQPDSVADDLGREAMPGIAGAAGYCHPTCLSGPIHPHKPDSRQLDGARQYVTTGNVAANDRVSLFLMDYAHQRRLKIFGRMQVTDADDDPALAAKLSVPDYPGRVERVALITIEAFDWNCPQHITPRFTEAELAEALAPVRREMEALRAENEKLRRRLEAGAEMVEGM